MTKQEFVDTFVQLALGSQNKVVRRVLTEKYIFVWQDEPNRHGVANVVWRAVAKQGSVDTTPMRLQQYLDDANVVTMLGDARKFALLGFDHQFRVSYALAQKASKYKDTRTILDWGMLVERLRHTPDKEWVYMQLVKTFGSEEVTKAIDEEGE